jgi:lysophospholipase L1-like esterase
LVPAFHPQSRFVLVLVLAAWFAGPALGENAPPQFLKRVLDQQYFAEGIQTGDIDGDGHLDLVCGPLWFEGPAFGTAHLFYDGTNFPNDRGYSNTFFSFVDDIDDDGLQDILRFGLPGTPAYWYRNPGRVGATKPKVLWERHLVFEAIDNESPTYVDITGDGIQEIVCSFGGKLGYVAPGKEPSDPWLFHPCSSQGTWHKYTHGLGVGDIDGDGRLDIVTSTGWWQQPKSLDGDPTWTAHHYPFSRRRGGGQMHCFDVDGDGNTDVITSLDGHGWGLVWHEQLTGDDNEPPFRVHRIMDDRSSDNRYGVSFSQLHALAMADLDGDGLQDIITGKCYWAHNGADQGARDPSVLYAFLLRRDENRTWFEPHLIDSDSGVGRQIVTRDVTGNGRVDIVTSNKKGIFLFDHQNTPFPQLTSIWHTAVAPLPRTGSGWQRRHTLLTQRARAGTGEILFLGDSITQGWEGSGRAIWKEFYEQRKAVNLGISGDRTQHVLWRLQHGNTDNVAPKACVLMIGTNNSRDNTSDEIAAGVESIIREIRFRLPSAKILVLAIFPRGPDNQDVRRKVNEAANKKIATFADQQMVHYLDIGPEFLNDDSTLSREIMPDLLHLSEAGYRIWAESIESKLKVLLQK